MAIQYKHELKGDTLEVVASGKDDSLEDVMGYAAGVLEVAKQSGCKKIFCDERDLIYNLSTFDAVQYANYAAANARKLGKVAVVCSPEFLEEGKFVETAATNRGLVVYISAHYQTSRDWLDK